jgi:hypothetical protein
MFRCDPFAQSWAPNQAHVRYQAVLLRVLRGVINVLVRRNSSGEQLGVTTQDEAVSTTPAVLPS